MSKMKVYYKNRLSSLVASATAIGFDADNITSLVESSLWKGVGIGDHTITFDAGAGSLVPADFLGIANHNLDKAKIELQYSSTNFGLADPIWICDVTTKKAYNVEADGTLVFSFLITGLDAGATSPMGITVAPDRSLWIIDNASDKIYNATPDGVLISSFATSVFDAGATSPLGMDYDYFDNTLWVCDSTTNKVYNITQAGALISSFAKSNISGVAKGDNGTLWLSDVTAAIIYNVNTLGGILSSFATSVFDASATQPTDISVNHEDNTLWITDNLTKKIYNVTTSGTWISEFATSVFDAGATNPNGISFASDVNDSSKELISSFPIEDFDVSAIFITDITEADDGTLWICDSNQDKIYNVSPDGVLISSFATSVFDASATQPTGITWAPDNTLWVSDIDTDKIYNISLTGTLISSFPTLLFFVQSLSYAPDGTLWIVDNNTDIVYNITLEGNRISSFPTSVFDAGALDCRGISFNPIDNTLLICENTDNLIYGIKTDGTLLFTMSTAEIDPLFTTPQGLTAAADGSFWINSFTQKRIYNARSNYVVSNKPFLRDFTQSTARYWRLKLTNLSVVPFIGIGYWGESVEWDFPDFFDPDAQDDKAIINVSPTGHMLGINNKFVERNINIGFSGVRDGSQIWKAITDWWKDHGLQVLFISIDIEDRPNDVFFVHPDPKFRGPFISSVYRNVSLKFRGR